MAAVEEIAGDRPRREWGEEPVTDRRGEAFDRRPGRKALCERGSASHLGDDENHFRKRKAKVVALMADAEPIPEPDLDRCVALLHNFEDLWQGEPEPKERQAFVRLVFERIAVDGGQITAVEPRPDLLPLFADRPGVYSGSDGTRTRACHPVEIRV